MHPEPENEIINFFKLIKDEKTRITNDKKRNLEMINLFINPNIENDPEFISLMDEFDEKYKGRIINHKNINYKIKYFDKKTKTIQGMMLYDFNGIKVDEKKHDELKLYSSIDIKDLFDKAYILSEEKSREISNDYIYDKKNYISIFYGLRVDEINGTEGELIPYKISPNNTKINQYNIYIEENKIKSVENKENKSFVIFDSILIEKGKDIFGLDTSSKIRVYTTLYSKDIINILHIHLNDSSQEITIDSEFLGNNEYELSYKFFTIDSNGKRLRYKFIFKEDGLKKIYYCVSNSYVDEPPFEEIRIKPNNYVKISKGKYANYYAKIKDFPIGMLVRKDKEEINSELYNNYEPNYYKNNEGGFCWLAKKITKREFRKKGECL